MIYATRQMWVDGKEEFVAWLAVAAAGEICHYFEGFLMGCRLQKTVALRDRVWEASEAGMVDLLQKKVDSGLYQYFAVKRRLPYKPVLRGFPQSAGQNQYTKHAKMLIAANNGNRNFTSLNPKPDLLELMVADG